MTLLPSRAAITANVPFPLSFQGGTPPYTFSLLPSGAGGSVVQTSGNAARYTAPSTTNDDPYNHPEKSFDTIQVQDSLGATATLKTFVGTVPMLVADIIQTEMNLANEQVYLWDQKITIPKDSRLYVAIAEMSSKPFANNSTLDSDGNAIQTINVKTVLSIDILSRGVSARDRKEEILMALGSQYAESQMALNSFYVGKLPTAFLNLSEKDGAAIPYRFNITVNLQFSKLKSKAVPYFDTFESVQVTDEP